MKKIFTLLIVSFLILAGCGQSSVDIINPEAEFRYFYGSTCPHCQELNGLVQDEDLFSKITVEKREVYFNTDNRDMFLALTKELGLSEKDTGVPFVYDTVSGKHAVGVGPALELFKSRLSGDTISPTEIIPEIKDETDSASGEVSETLPTLDAPQTESSSGEIFNSN